MIWSLFVIQTGPRNTQVSVSSGLSKHSCCVSHGLVGLSPTAVVAPNNSFTSPAATAAGATAAGAPGAATAAVPTGDGHGDGAAPAAGATAEPSPEAATATGPSPGRKARSPGVIKMDRRDKGSGRKVERVTICTPRIKAAVSTAVTARCGVQRPAALAAAPARISAVPLKLF